MGTTPISNNCSKVFWALMYWVLCLGVRKLNHAYNCVSRLTSAISFLVKRICATGTRRCENKLSQRLISRHWPTAASACRVQLSASLTITSSFLILTPSFSRRLSSYLYSRQVCWPLVPVHPSQPNANSTRRDQYHTVAIFAQSCYRLDNQCQN